MSTRGIFRDGRFERCGDGARGVPQCMGRAVHNCEGPDARRCGCCTCPAFSVDEMRFAKEHRLTIEHERDMPIEWRARRGSGAMCAAKGDTFCAFCFEPGPVVLGENVSICEACARKALALFTKTLVADTGRRLRAVPTETS